MTSRERVATALEHRTPDRVPVDFGARDEVWNSLQAYMGANTREEILQRLGVDCRFVLPDYTGPGFKRSIDGCGRMITYDEWGIGRVTASVGQNGAYEEIVSYPLETMETLEALEDYPWPDPCWWDYASVQRKIQEFDGEYWISSGYYSIFERAWNMRGMERFLLDLVVNPEFACAIMDHILEFYVEQTVRILEAADGRIDMIYTCDDVGTQQGMMISPDMWKTYVKPRQARFNQIIKKYGVKIFYHSCGSIRPIIDDLIEIGVDVLNPIQSTAKDMSFHELKREYGKRLAFHGGVDIQELLPFGDEEAIIKIVDELIDVLGRDGGYILAPTHAVQVDTTPRKIIMLYEHIQGGLL